MGNLELSSGLVRAIKQVLRPLVRLMLAGGITYPALAELLKGIFVEVADKEFRLGEAAPTDSRISLLTGIHRKDVKRLRALGVQADMPMPEAVSVGAQLVATWLSQPPFVDEQGNPRPLPRLASQDQAASFEQLVASRSKDIRARVVLDEWLRLGIVSMDEQGRVALNTEAFVPRAGMDEQWYYFAHNLRDHAAAAVHNLTAAGEPWLERSVHYDALSQESIDELHAQARQQAVQVLKSLSASATRLEARDANVEKPRQRFTCGVYFYSEPTGEDQ